MGESATEPIEQRYGRLVALLLGISPLVRVQLPNLGSKSRFHPAGESSWRHAALAGGGEAGRAGVGLIFWREPQRTGAGAAKRSCNFLKV